MTIKLATTDSATSCANFNALWKPGMNRNSFFGLPVETEPIAWTAGSVRMDVMGFLAGWHSCEQLEPGIEFAIGSLTDHPYAVTSTAR
jgi:hypothetical protein